MSRIPVSEPNEPGAPAPEKHPCPACGHAMTCRCPVCSGRKGGRVRAANMATKAARRQALRDARHNNQAGEQVEARAPA